MDIEICRAYCLQKRGATESFPFGSGVLVFKVQGKMFALMSLDEVPHRISLKCDPEKAVDLRLEYEGLIEGAYHMNKRHWNSLQYQSLPPVLVQALIDHSYNLVVQGLSRKQQQELNKNIISDA